MDKKLRRCETCEYYKKEIHTIETLEWHHRFAGYCKFNPEPLSRRLDDWCGQWQEVNTVFFHEKMTAAKVLKAQKEYHKANEGFNKVIYQIQDIYKKGFDAVCEHLKSLEAK